MNLYHPSSSLSPSMTPTMNHPSLVNHPFFQTQQLPHFGERYVPSLSPYTSNSTLPSSSNSTLPSTSNSTLPSTSYPPDLVVDYNLEQTMSDMVDDRYHPTISHQNSIDNSTSFARTMHYLEHVPFLERKTLSLDCTVSDFTRILETLAAVPGMQEIELTLPTCKLEHHSIHMIYMQHAFIRGLEAFTYTGRHWHLKRLTIPMEFITSLLLSYLAILPHLETLTINYSLPPRSPHHHHQRQQFPAWSSLTIPAECPGYVFLAHLKFDPRKHFEELKTLDLRTPLSDVSYTTLRRLFPKTYIRCET